jgi:hypothetical protein
MKSKEIKLPLTPLTDETFKRQKWYKHVVGDVMSVDDEEGEYGSESDEEVYYYTLPLPRSRGDEYAPRLTSNSTDEIGILKDMGLAPGTFFVELLGTEGLGYCASEEELEILYKVLTGEEIEDK